MPKGLSGLSFLLSVLSSVSVCSSVVCSDDSSVVSVANCEASLDEFSLLLFEFLLQETAETQIKAVRIIVSILDLLIITNSFR